MKPAEFSQYWNQQATSYTSPQCLVDQIQVQKSIQVVATDQMPDHTENKSDIISIDRNITDSIVRKVIDVR